MGNGKKSRKTSQAKPHEPTPSKADGSSSTSDAEQQKAEQAKKALAEVAKAFSLGAAAGAGRKVLDYIVDTLLPR